MTTQPHHAPVDLPQRPDTRRTSLKDVALAAGVSIATASRALSQPTRVNKDTLKRIRAAADQLGYMPDGSARALRSRRSHLIGTVLPTLDYAIYNNQIAALQQTLGEHGYFLLVTSSDYDQVKELHQSRTLIERGVEGLVLVGGNHHPELSAMLRARNIPVIDTYVYHPLSERSCVGFNNETVVAKVIHHLVDIGHERIAMIAGITEGNDRANDRVVGVCKALAARGLTLPDQYLIEKPYKISAGRQALRSLLAAHPTPTAVFCGSDVLAFGVLAECAEQNIAVPEQLSVVGFDNLEFCAHFHPGLTTIEVPAAAMGQEAGRHLITCLSGKAGIERQELEANLILRGTTGPPPG